MWGTDMLSNALKFTPDGQEAPENPAMQQLTGRHILLVEDNELNQEIAVIILEEVGNTVDVFSDGARAVEKVPGSVDSPYDLLLMDIQMSVMDGIEATKIIRAMADSRLARLQIVALTANALESGITKYIKDKRGDTGASGRKDKQRDLQVYNC